MWSLLIFYKYEQPSLLTLGIDVLCHTHTDFLAGNCKRMFQTACLWSSE